VAQKSVKKYSCGPTIYNYVHIGNLRTFSYEDLLVRMLKFKGYNVTHVRNLTDVEDKIIKSLRENDKSIKNLQIFMQMHFLKI
jgi:cysteinyl-tRNA synthetase